MLTGCAGGGGGNAGAAGVITNNGTFGGALAPVVGRGGSTQTSVTLRIDGDSGSASFKSGSYGDTSFVSYSADITNVVVTPNPSDEIVGNIQFDMTNFTPGAPFANLHWNGTYEWNHVVGQGAALDISGTVTGTDSNGNAVNIPFTLDYAFFPHVVSYTGNWSGTIDVPKAGTLPWSGNFTKIDDSHTNVAINYGGGQFNVAAITTNISLAGQFDASEFIEGAVGNFYVERNPEFSDDNHFIGGYTISFGGVPVVGGVITGEKATGPTLSTGYYQGTLTPNGGVQHSLSIDLLTTGSAVEARGAVSMNPSSNNPVIGARITTATTSNGTATVTFNNFGLTQINPTFSGRYTSMTLTGTPTVNGFNGTYVAQLTAGGTETGSFSSQKLSNVPRFDISGQWSGTATGGNGQGTPNSFGGEIFQTGDEITLNAIQNVNGTNVDVSIHGYVVGNTFVGNAVNESVTIMGVPGTLSGHFEGVIGSNGTQITGEFAYTATVTGLGSISDNGTFTLNNQQ